MMHGTLHQWKERIKKLNILLIGDAILDCYLNGVQTRFCREAPVPVFKVIKEEIHGGGAANTAINLKSLGVDPVFISCIGNDSNSVLLLKNLSENEIDTKTISIEENRSIVTKKRFVTDNTILFRSDEGESEAFSEETIEQIMATIESNWKQADIIIIADYNTGLFTPKMIESLLSFQNKNHKNILVDAHHPEHFALLKPFAVKPNYQESIQTLALPIKENEEREKQLIDQQKALHRSLGSPIIFQTLDKNGVLLFQRNKETLHLHSKAIETNRTIGAGDTFTAALAIAFALGFTPEEAADWAHTAASLVIQKAKTASCTLDELWTCFHKFPKYHSSIQELEESITQQRKEGRSVVFTNGCFDILHKGHIRFLEEAKKLGDILIVALNDDNSIRQLKGENRPVNNLQDRIAVLSALEYIDHIISFNSLTCEHLIYALIPDIFVKGSSYLNKSIPETKAIKDTGGKICILPSSSYSTSALLKRIQNKV